MKHKAPTLRSTTLHGKKTWLVTWPNPDGKRPNRKFFALEKEVEAKAFLNVRKVEFENFGKAAFSLPEALRSDAIRAAEILAPTGKTILDAAKITFDLWQREQGGKPIAEAVEDYLTRKEADKVSRIYLAILKSRLRVFANACPKSTSAITDEDITQFLDGLEGYSPTTISNWRRILSVFFNWCKVRKLCNENPAESVKRKAEDGEPEIITPQQTSTLLASCDPDLLPVVAIAAFCGLRQTELQRLDWSAVNVAEGHITIGAKIAKTSSRRVVSMPENLQAFLRSYKDSNGPIWPEAYESKWDLARIAAGYGPFFSTTEAVNLALTKAKKAKRKLQPWPSNALRHSAISYRVALEKDLAKIAYESGNSPAVIQRHYNGLASPTAAKAYFAIMPSTPANVVKMKGAA